MAPVRRPKLVILSGPDTPEPSNRERLEGLADVVVGDADSLATLLPGSEVLLLWDFFSAALREAWHAADALEWVHVAAAGVDAMLFPELARSSVVVTNSSGVFDRPIAEFVLGAILARDKRMLESRRLQEQHLWLHRDVALTLGTHALVIGTGGIGRAIARLLAAVGMEVRGAGRTGREGDPDFRTVVPSAELSAHVGWADHVVLAAPLTDATRHLVDEEVLEAMRPTGHLVNVGRGALVDEQALVGALRSGSIAYATLDVFETEPLPGDHPFWGLEQVAVSAHMCGDFVGWRDALAALFEANLRRYTMGEKLLNVVDQGKGYTLSQGS